MFSNISYLANSSSTDVGMSDLEIQRLNYPKWGHQIVGLFLMFVGILGFIENSLVLFTFYKSKQLLSPTNVFILGLAIGDFSMVIFGNPLAFTSALNGGWFAGDFMCTWEGFIVYFIGCSQVYLMMAIAVDRYIVIAKPLKSSMITKRVAALCVAACFGGGLFWALMPFAGWSAYGLEASGSFCGLHYEDSSKSYIMLIFIFDFFIPLLVTIYSYFKVFMTVANVNKTMVWDMKSRVARKNLKLERKMLKSCIIMCVCFWACWFPYALVSFWQTFGNPESVPIWLAEIPAAAAKSEVIFNPVIYVATNKQFRQAFYKNLPCSGLRDMLVKREEEKVQSSKESDISDKHEDPATNNANPNAVAPVAEHGPTMVEC
ncbi:visual pigment-like receptor peropsin [Mercenaria mercenaria]|uniref:visual pigment-like receptor peropsin n=1 Tax=Mercenaria mercenaria TaxID=6596 RepID=UPI00234E9228|nr:visual pigment-like receptor peropsin [Mercenaria mercenaria]